MRNKRICPVCKIEFEPHGPQIYCTPKCRTIMAERRRKGVFEPRIEKVEKRKEGFKPLIKKIHKVCLYCNKRFMPVYPDQLFCRPLCAIQSASIARARKMKNRSREGSP